MTIAIIAVVCVVLLVLAFVFPRLSRHPERGVNSTLGVGERGARLAPGKLGKWLAKPFQSSRKATSKSAGAGRKGRGKLPL
jgi:hypothetical protein